MDRIIDQVVYEVEIPGFPGYSINNFGKVHNIRTGREMVLSPNQHGDLSVGLMRHGVQSRRSVRRLVAEAFVEGWSPIHNTPILLNQDKEDLTPDNICWRPRWFAWKYVHQFEEPKEWFFNLPIREVYSGVEYDNILIASILNGLLCNDIFLGIHNEQPIYPTNQRFEYI